MRKMAVAAALLPVSLYAQWLHFKSPGIPRTPDGKPNLTAPAPRTADGHPDLSGLWAPAPNGYWVDIIHDIKDEAIFKPAAEAIFQKRIADFNHDGPYTRCLPLGPGDIFIGSYRIMQSPAEVALLQNGSGADSYRQIFMDGREMPEDPNPTWRGYSIGRWEGDTLVVETGGFNDRGWLDMVGHPRSEKLHVTERFRRVDFGHIQFQITIEDSEALTKPLTIPVAMNYLPDTEMLEIVCNENERDRAHLATTKFEPRGLKLSADALAKYAGTFGLITVTLVKDQLYLWDLPLFPQSETTFESSIATVEFSLDSTGAVIGITLVGALGDEFRFARGRLP